MIILQNLIAVKNLEILTTTIKNIQNIQILYYNTIYYNTIYIYIYIFFVLSNMAHRFENVCEIIPD